MKSKRRYDWFALKTEFLHSGETLNAFRKRKEIHRDSLYLRARRENWMALRDQLRAKAAVRVISSAEDALVEKWTEYIDLWQGVKQHAAALLAQPAITASDLKALMQAIDITLKDERLIRGQSTANVSSLNVHAIVLKDLQENKNSFAVTPEELEADAKTSSE